MPAGTRQCGATLTEVLVTLAILSFGVTGVARMQLDLLLATGQGKARTEALTLVEAKLEALRTTTQPNPYGKTSDTQSGLTGSNSIFELHWDIEPTHGGVHYKVWVGAGWEDPRGIRQELRIDTLVPATDPAWAARTLD